MEEPVQREDQEEFLMIALFQWQFKFRIVPNLQTSVDSYQATAEKTPKEVAHTTQNISKTMLNNNNRLNNKKSIFLKLIPIKTLMVEVVAIEIHLKTKRKPQLLVDQIIRHLRMKREVQGLMILFCKKETSLLSISSNISKRTMNYPQLLSISINL